MLTPEAALCLAIAAISAGIYLFVYAKGKRENEPSNNLRLQQLLWEAEERWRGKPTTEALDNLSVLILSNIVRTRRAGKSTDDLEEDYRLVIDERRRLQLEQAEMDSAFVEVRSEKQDMGCVM